MEMSQSSWDSFVLIEKETGNYTLNVLQRCYHGLRSMITPTKQGGSSLLRGHETSTKYCS